MPNRKKFNARFPPARIKKIMRTDKEVGKVAAPVPAVISRALELFAEQLLQRAGEVTLARGSRTLSPAHLKQCIQTERRFDFLKELVEDIPDAAESEEAGGSSCSTPAPPPAEPTPPPPAHSHSQPTASSAPRPVGRPPKYLKMEIPTSVPASSNGQPHSAPAGRPPVPGLIHTSLLTGGAMTAAAVSGEQFAFAAIRPQLLLASASGGVLPPPPPAHRGPSAALGLPPLAVRYGSMPDSERPGDGL